MIALETLLARLGDPARSTFRAGDGPVRLVFSVCDGRSWATMIDAKAATFTQAWHEGAERLRIASQPEPRWLRVTWGESVAAGEARRGLFAEVGSDEIQILEGSAVGGVCRHIVQLMPADLVGLISAASAWLAAQADADGRLAYGWLARVDRPLEDYDPLDQAAAAAAMIEAWEVTGAAALKAAIERALGFLIGNLVRKVRLADGSEVAFVVDDDDGIRLGGTAFAILAFANYARATGALRFHQLLDALGAGLLHMQQPGGGFASALAWPALTPVEAPHEGGDDDGGHDGAAALALIRLHALTGTRNWLDAADGAFTRFIAEEDWRLHDPWLALAADALGAARPERPCLAFGVRILAARLATMSADADGSPAALTLLAAGERLASRLATSEHRDLLDGFEIAKLDRALDASAHGLLGRHFWPERAMDFPEPDRLLGSFFDPDDDFRVRIGEVAQALSGFVAYLRYLEKTVPAGAETVPADMSEIIIA